MDLVQLIFLGLLSGLIVGGPYGPSGSLALLKSMQGGWRLGMITTIGCLIPILLYAFLSATFVEVMTGLAESPRFIFFSRLLGGLMLLIFGVIALRRIRREVADPDAPTRSERIDESITNNFLTGLVVALVSGKNIIGYPAFVLSSPFPPSAIDFPIWSAIVFSLASLFSAALLFLLVVWFGIRGGGFYLRHEVTIQRGFGFLFIGMGLFLIVPILFRVVT